jgi:hypothetical protein
MDGTSRTMAQRHKKKAGQWAKGKAKERDRQFFLGAIMFATFGSIILGFVAGRVREPWALLAFMVVAPPIVWFAMRRFGWWADRISLERLRFMRGGQAEAFVSWRLQDAPESWHLIDNIERPDGGDIDHVLVGPGGLFVVSTKSYKGHLTRAATGALMFNGRPMTAEIDEAQQLAMHVRDRLRAVMGARVPWVRAVLAWPMAKVDVQPTALNVWIVDDDTMLETLTPEKPTKRIAPKLVEEIVDALRRPVGGAGG